MPVLIKNVVIYLKVIAKVDKKLEGTGKPSGVKTVIASDSNKWFWELEYNLQVPQE